MNDKLQSFMKSVKSLKGTLLVIIIFIFLFAFINLIISVKSKHESAYSALSREHESTLKLQDTRVHNWNEIDKGMTK